MYRAIGELRERVSFRKQKRKPATSSGFVGSDPQFWANSVPAKIEQIAGSEGQEAGMRGINLPFLVTVRYSMAKNPSVLDEIVWGEQILNIDSAIDPDGRRKQWEMHCTAVTVMAA